MSSRAATMQARMASTEDGKEARQPAAAAAGAAQGQTRVFPTGMLKVFLGFLLIGVGLSAFGMYMAQHTLAAAAPALFRPCLGASAAAEEELEGLERWTRPPARVRHAMTDEELLWRASFTPRVRGYPFRRVPKVAFMFLTRGPLPLAPLWERFFRGHEGRYSIYVHALPSYHANFTSDSVFYRRQIPSKDFHISSSNLATLLMAQPQGKLMGTIRKPITAASSFHQSTAKRLQPLVTLARRNGIGRRCLLTLLTSTAAISEAGESRKALLQEYLKKSKENKENNDRESKEPQDSPSPCHAYKNVSSLSRSKDSLLKKISLSKKGGSAGKVTTNMAVDNGALEAAHAGATCSAMSSEMAVSPSSAASSNHAPFTPSEIPGMAMDTSALDSAFGSDVGNTGPLQLGPDGSSRDSIRPLGQLWNFSISDFTADLTSLGDLAALENYTGTPFLPSDSDILLDSPDQDDIVEYFADAINGPSQSDEEKS